MWYLGLGVRYKLCLMVFKYYITIYNPYTAYYWVEHPTNRNWLG